MTPDEHNVAPQATRLLSFYVAADDIGLSNNSIMLCEVIGNEIQSVSLRVAADAMTKWIKPTEA